MSYSIILLRRAYNELLKSWLWYEDKQEGLGDRFKELVYAGLSDIEKHPERYPVRKRPYHEARLNIFPYLIIYRVNKKNKTIIVSSIFHARRNPKRKYGK